MQALQPPAPPPSPGPISVHSLLRGSSLSRAQGGYHPLLKPPARQLGVLAEDLVHGPWEEKEGRGKRGDTTGSHPFPRLRLQMKTCLRDVAGFFLTCGKGANIFKHFCSYNRLSQAMPP